jgi:excinuclease ABC subunit C
MDTFVPVTDFQQKLSSVPADPGVYLMKDAQEQVIYVGKARNLRKRLATYFKPAGHADMKTDVLVNQLTDFDTIVTRSEKEALILESNLIKRYRPRYNVVLKDDKRYPSLRLDLSEKYPNFQVVRKKKTRRGSVFRAVCFRLRRATNTENHQQDL